MAVPADLVYTAMRQQRTVRISDNGRKVVVSVAAGASAWHISIRPARIGVELYSRPTSHRDPSRLEDVAGIRIRKVRGRRRLRLE